MAPMSFETLLSNNPILQRIKVRLRRLLNEGFGGFILGISLFTVSVILINTYLHDQAALEDAVRNEILATVGTPQEPSDSAKELGLIASALSKVNRELASRSAQSWHCPLSDSSCAAIKRLPEIMAAEVRQNAKAAKTSVLPDTLASSMREVSAPRSLCSKPASGEKTFLMIPTQVRSPDKPYFTPRVMDAVRNSVNLDTAIRKLEAEFAGEGGFGRFVQAYFISPDSVLRIWTARDINLCEEFSPNRLWAAKSYFSYFWDNPGKDHYSTLVYVDYGGNGLVRTRCQALDAARTDRPSAGFPYLGVLCMDYKLPDQEVAKLKHQLFFETAAVSFPLSDRKDPEYISVTLKDEQPEAEPTHPAFTQDNVKRAGMSPPDTSAGEARKPQAKPSTEDIVIAMQESTLTEEEIQQALHSKLGRVDAHSLPREITAIQFRNKTAFLLPLGSSSGTFEGLFFYPRSPKLPRRDTWLAILGFLFAGAALATAAYSWRLSPKATELRERLTLFRNLQVGIVRVDQNDWILECNDRAEELFQRKLPKPGVTGLPVNFQQLIRFRVGQQDGAQFRLVTADEIAKARAKGLASSYFALVSNGQSQRWLRVAATPTMLARPDRIRGIGLVSVFATISEVSCDLTAELDHVFESFQDQFATPGRPQ